MLIIVIAAGIIVFFSTVFDTSSHSENELDLPPGTIEYLKPEPPPLIDCKGCGASYPGISKYGWFECAYCGRKPGGFVEQYSRSQSEVILSINGILPLPPIDRKEF